GARAGISEDTFRKPTLETILSKEFFRDRFRWRPGERSDGAHPGPPCDDGAMRITSAESTLLFAGQPGNPLQIMRITLAHVPAAGPVVARAEGAGVGTRQPLRIAGLEPGATHTAELPVAVAAPHGPGSALPVTVIAETPHARAQRDAVLTVAEPGWTIWMVS